MARHLYKDFLIKLKLIDPIEEYRKQGVRIGDNTTILGCQLDKTHPHLIVIGSNCTLTRCTLLTHDASTKRSLGKSKIGIISIGDNCFIGWGSIILPGVTIGDNCIVGAGAVVAKDIPNDSIVVGNPCRIIKKTSEYLDYQKELMKKSVCFDYDYSKMTNTEKNDQKKQLKRNRIGFDR